MKHQKKVFCIIAILFINYNLFSQAIIIDHSCAKLDPIPEIAIETAKQNLHIAYGHTSHGSQLTEGMSGLIGQTELIGYKGDIYDWNNGGSDGALDLHDYFGSGDLSHNGDTTWAPYTRTYLNNNPEVNVIIYSWCGGCSDNNYDGIQTYLNKMTELETDYPNVMFVYMTGHRDIWANEVLTTNNQHIRDYCIANNKILFDFADIESYDPDGNFYEFVNDNCNYYSDESGSNLLGNWATEWQDTHTEGIHWYNCSAAHTEALNGNLKAYAAWWLWCRLAGWEGTVNNQQVSIEKLIKVYPNPVKNQFIINYDYDQLLNADIKLYDLMGKIHYSNVLNERSKIVYTDRLENGLYILEIFKGSKRITQKITISN
jgi:hypothetical protein